MTTLPPPESFDVLSAYLDGELTPAEATEVRDLLERSPEHRAELDRVEQARTWLRALPPVEPPEGFIEQAIAAANRPGRRAEEAQVGDAQPRCDGSGLGRRPRLREHEPVERRVS